MIGRRPIEFVPEALVRVDLVSETNALVAQANHGLLPIDEVRALKNEPPLPDGMGKLPRMPANIVVQGAASASTASGEPVSGAESDARQQIDRDRLIDSPVEILRGALRRMHKRLALRAVQAAKKPDSFLDWIDGMEAANADILRSAIRPALNALAAWTGDDAAERVETPTREFFGDGPLMKFEYGRDGRVPCPVCDSAKTHLTFRNRNGSWPPLNSE